ncbi:MAG: peptidoglycan DD-metalloendopeptidase family protein [Woeseia sp.]
MHRPVSPLLHDYKPSAGTPARKSNPLRWFALGLGLPLLVLAGVLSLRNAVGSITTVAVEQSQDFGAVPPAVEESIASLYQMAEPYGMVVPPAQAAATQTLPAASFHPPLVYDEPQYDVLVHTIRSGDTLDRLFRRNNLSLGDLAQIVRLDGAAEQLRMLRPGDRLEIRHHEGKLLSLSRDLGLTKTLRVARNDDGFAAEFIERPVELRRNSAYGRIESSLFESAAAAGLSDKLIMNLAGIFAWDVDFVLDIRRKDDYYIIYEEIWQDEKFVSTGEIIAAEFNNNGRTFQAIRYIDADGRADYFTPEGRSVRKAFVRAPVDFSRISSNFNPTRRHPILNTIRAHKGVDYAAPSGTPIKAAGDGKVIFRGRKGGYGNTVILQHGGNITTLYAHMSGFAKNAPIGGRVKQGQTIGFVGSTGLATAAHLHYEYRLNGVHRNPRTVQLPQADPIKDVYRNDFMATAAPILDELKSYKRTQIATATYD